MSEFHTKIELVKLAWYRATNQSPNDWFFSSYHSGYNRVSTEPPYPYMEIGIWPDTVFEFKTLIAARLAGVELVIGGKMTDQEIDDCRGIETAIIHVYGNPEAIDRFCNWYDNSYTWPA